MLGRVVKAIDLKSWGYPREVKSLSCRFTSTFLTTSSFETYLSNSILNVYLVQQPLHTICTMVGVLAVLFTIEAAK